MFWHGSSSNCLKTGPLSCQYAVVLSGGFFDIGVRARFTSDVVDSDRYCSIHSSHKAVNCFERVFIADL